MIPHLRSDSDRGKRFPDVVRRYNERIAAYNAEMSKEAKLVVPFLVGGWFVLLLIAQYAERFDPVFRTSGVFLLISSVGYWLSRRVREKNELKNVLRELESDIALRSMKS